MVAGSSQVAGCIQGVDVDNGTLPAGIAIRCHKASHVQKMAGD